MTPDEWVAEFARREREYVSRWKAFREKVSRLAQEARDRELFSHLRGVPVVLEAGVEIEASWAPDSADKAQALALECGWAPRIVYSRAAVPATGMVEAITVRLVRGDERIWAAWWNGQFKMAWRMGPEGLEALAGSRLATRQKTAATAAARAGAPVPAITQRGLLDAIEGRQ